MPPLKLGSFIGANETDDKLAPGQIPYGRNVELGDPVGVAKKRGGMEALFASLGAGSIKGLHTYRRSSGNIIMLGHGTTCRKASGVETDLVKTSIADFDAGTHADTEAVTIAGDDQVRLVTDSGASETVDISQTDTAGGAYTTGSGVPAQTFLAPGKLTAIEIYKSSVFNWVNQVLTITVYKWDTNYATTVAGAAIGTASISGPQSINSWVKGTFGTPLTLVSGDSYLFTLTAAGGGLDFTYSSASAYAGGVRYAAGVAQADDLSFKTYYSPYEATGTWLSPVYDLTNTPILSSLARNDVTPANTSIVYQVKGSLNNINWGDWRTITSSGDGIPLTRYVQHRIIFTTTDTRSTPATTDFTITHTTSFTTTTSLATGLTGNTIRFADADNKCFFSDGGRPQVYNGTAVRDVGVDIPGTAPTMAAGASTGLTGVYKGKVTFVNADGVESNACTSNGTTGSLSNQDIAWSSIPVLADHNRRLYRTKAGADVYYLLTEIEDDSTTTYTDTTADVDLTELMLDDNDIPGNASIIHVHKNIMFYVDADNLRYLKYSKVAGAMAGFTGAGLEQFPTEYYFVMPNDIIGLGTTADALIVRGVGYAKAIYGTIFGGDADNTEVKDVDSLTGGTSHESAVECVDPDQRNIYLVPTKEGVNYLTRGLQDQSLEAAPISYAVQKYFIGASSHENQSAIFFDSRYYVAVTYYAADEVLVATNNMVLVYDFKSRQWYPPWEMNIAAFTVANGTLYGGDSTKGVVYELNTGSSDDGSNIHLILDMRHRFRAKTRIKVVRVEASIDSVVDDLVVKIQVDGETTTLTPGANADWEVQAAVDGYGQQKAMQSPRMYPELSRGYYYGVRVEDDSTNPIEIYSIISDVKEGIR